MIHKGTVRAPAACSISMTSHSVEVYPGYMITITNQPVIWITSPSFNQVAPLPLLNAANTAVLEVHQTTQLNTRLIHAYCKYISHGGRFSICRLYSNFPYSLKMGTPTAPIPRNSAQWTLHETYVPARPLTRNNHQDFQNRDSYYRARPSHPIPNHYDYEYDQSPIQE